MGSVDTMYLDNLEEYIYDENKIVTYRWLSSTLKVNVNQAKQMLYAFTQNHKKNQKNKCELNVTYFIAGLSKAKDDEEHVHKCAVVSEGDLETFKSSLQVVTSSHVYSVQKSKLKDLNSLYTADYDIIKESGKYSAITCPWATIRPDSDRPVYRPSTTNDSSTGKGKQVNGDASHSEVKPKTTHQKKGGIQGMFANAAKKAETKQESKKEEPTKTEETSETKTTTASSKTKAGKDKKAGVMSFFSKQTEKKTETTTKKESPTKKEEKVKEKSPAKKEQATSKSKPTKPQKRKDESSKSDKQNKRRRIQEISDSSSEEEIDIEDESPIPSPVPSPEPTEPESPIPEKKKESEPEASPVKQNESKTKGSHDGERKRKRTRKLVPKTFMDADGYMVTEKVWESESTDASDTEPPPKKSTEQPKKASPQKKAGSPKKKSPPSTGTRKQANLMSFFKKK